MNNTPGALAFHCDMLLDIPLIADLITIHNSRQAIIDESLRIANLHRLNHDYRVNEQVLFKVYAPHCRTCQCTSTQAVSILIPMRLPLLWESVVSYALYQGHSHYAQRTMFFMFSRADYRTIGRTIRECIGLHRRLYRPSSKVAL